MIDSKPRFHELLRLRLDRVLDDDDDAGAAEEVPVRLRWRLRGGGMSLSLLSAAIPWSSSSLVAMDTTSESSSALPPLLPLGEALEAASSSSSLVSALLSSALLNVYFGAGLLPPRLDRRRGVADAAAPGAQANKAC